MISINAEPAIADRVTSASRRVQPRLRPRASGGDMALLREFIELFLDRAPGQLERLRDAT